MQQIGQIILTFILVKDLVLVSLGMGIGVVLMCIAQVSKMADEQMKEIKKERIDKE